MPTSKDTDDWDKDSDGEDGDDGEEGDDLDDLEPEEPVIEEASTDKSQPKPADEEAEEAELFADDIDLVGDSDQFDDEEGEDYVDLESEISDLDNNLPDDYWSYIDEQMGYADVDRDSIPPEDVARHEQIRAMDLAELQALELSGLSDYCKWGAARAYLEKGDEQAFENLALALLRSDERSPALDHVDIALTLMCRGAGRGHWTLAFELLERLDELAPGDVDLKERFRGILTLKQGRIAHGLDIIAGLADRHIEDGHFLLILGEDLCGTSRWDEALEYLEMARDIARNNNDQELLASIDNAVQYAQRRLGTIDGDRP